jgi:hypothetical protein
MQRVVQRRRGQVGEATLESCPFEADELLGFVADRLAVLVEAVRQHAVSRSVAF